MTEVVSDDAPPAVLFRLSYRTQNHYRSGHRSEDSREQVVNSMRGWWEIDPRDLQSLGVKHAAAFHAGVTLAVVRIGDWKWLHTEGDEHHTTPVDDRGQPMNEFDWTNPLPSVRWAFDVADDPMADIAHGAWIGERGKLVPARLRDTIKSYWPDSPDDSIRDLLGKALELFGISLRLLNESTFRPALGENWQDDLCRRHNVLKRQDFGAALDDPYVHLKILLSERAASSTMFGHNGRQRLRYTERARNRWAHFADIDGEQTRRDVVGMIDVVARGRMAVEADGRTIDNERIDQLLARLENIRRALDFQLSRHKESIEAT